jgi:hypothetical protein
MMRFERAQTETKSKYWVLEYSNVKTLWGMGRNQQRGVRGVTCNVRGGCGIVEAK